MTKEEQVIETIRKGPGMSPNEYQRLALRTASEESMKDPLLNGLLGLGGKTGECQDLYKKHRFQGHELDKAKMAKELGDVSWYRLFRSDCLRSHEEHRPRRRPFSETT